IKSLIMVDSITLYWEKLVAGTAEYRIWVDGVYQGCTKKTHYKLESLEAGREYCSRVEKACDEAGNSITLELEELCLRTIGRKVLRNITGAPYHAVGDGKTMNTKCIQQAIDDCGTDEAVYIPAGVFLTGALRLHSDMELYIEQDG
ncbi:glycosyl hydrolase family 28-related protein, partial [Clostridioides difficile]|nr:glycosyl hydrolase family 28-related protein [Clostridioides difficile]